MRQDRSNRLSSTNGYSSRLNKLVIPKNTNSAKIQIEDLLARWGFIQSYTKEDQLFVKSIIEATVVCFKRQL